MRGKRLDGKDHFHHPATLGARSGGRDQVLVICVVGAEVSEPVPVTGVTLTLNT